MTNASAASGASVLALTVADIHATFENSLASREAPAMLVTLAALIACAPEAIAGAEIGLIDRDRGLLRVRDPDGALVDVALGVHAALAVETAIGGRTHGPLVPDGHGAPLRPVRMDERVQATPSVSSRSSGSRCLFERHRIGLSRALVEMLG